MNLIEFIKEHGNQASAAAALGLSQGMVSGRVTGRYPMTADAAIDLELRSNGVMSRYDLNPVAFPRPIAQE